MTAPTPDSLDLSGILARLNAASSGWLAADQNEGTDAPERWVVSNEDWLGARSEDSGQFMHTDEGISKADAVFIARAAEDIRSLIFALAAVTAERDQERGQHEATKSTLDKAWDDLRQARQMLADAEKKIASMELDESLREEDERFADPL